MPERARAREVETLFHEALDLPPAERAALLARRCGRDTALRAAVQALLDEDARGTRGLLRAPALTPPAEAPERIGRYRLVRVLGEGGMGTVHLAEQEEPVRRRVALKTIRLGSFSPAAAARFAAECQALAEMDHPDIAKVFDGGRTEAGLPYLVMEYAPGLPLTDHCDRHRLTLAGRLELMARVCDAVEHAHQKGIVHRDLKPGNVLVDVRDGRHEPRVIDFGLARALAGSLVPGEPPQPLADRLGTPAYMSPARLAGTSGTDTRDDVYALGVMLYELVTGHHPFEPATRAERLRALDAQARAPSATLAALGPELVEVAELRSTTPRRLLARVRGELDALVLRALAGEAAARYPSADALASDLRRFLAHETLVGIHAPARVRARNFLRRHWIGAGLGTLLVLGLGLGLVLQVRARATAELGWHAADAARAAAEEARAEALRVRDREHGERAEADLLVRAFKEALLLAQAGEGSEEPLAVEDLLGVLATHVENLGQATPGAEAALRSALGRAYLVLGLEREALQQYLRALAVGAGALADDPLDRFEILEGLIESSRRTDDLPAARGYVRQALATAREVFAGRDADFHAALETLLALAAGEPTDGARAVTALETLLEDLPDAVVRGDESGVTARILTEAAVQLVQRRSPQASDFLARLEACAQALLAPEDVRRVTFLWTLVHVRLQEGAEVGPEAVAAARALVRAAEQRLGAGHWLRSDARRLLGHALRVTGALEEAEGELLAALAEARQPSRNPRRLELARAELADLARSVAARPPPELARFVARSGELHGAREGSWWLVQQPGLPAELGAAALLWLEGLQDPRTLPQRGMLLVRLHRLEEALQAFAATPDELDPLARVLRVEALAGLGRLPEARRELLALAEVAGRGPRDPELAERLAELRVDFGL
ncbi:MAG TPA: serine/threonine-protein kinase [Planctomycetota bacterium]